jgi:hypothetical protein
MATKSPPKKPRTDRNTTITRQAFEILETAKKYGHKKIDFASAAILVHGKAMLGSAVPASPEDVLEARLEYLEFTVAFKEWDAMCEDNPKRAKNLRRYVAKAKHSPFSRNFEELNNRRREAGGKGTVGRHEWIVAAFAEKFGFPMPNLK